MTNQIPMGPDVEVCLPPVTTGANDDGKENSDHSIASDCGPPFQADESATKSVALQAAILNSTNFFRIVTDAKGVIKLFSVGAEHMLGYAAADVVDIMTPANISDPLELIARTRSLSVEAGSPTTADFEALVLK